MSFVVRAHSLPLYNTASLASLEECKLLASTGSDVGLFSLSLPHSLFLYRLIPRASCVAHVIYMWAGGQQRCDGARLCVVQARTRARTGADVVQTFIRGKGVRRCRQDVLARLVKELPVIEGQPVTKDMRRDGYRMRERKGERREKEWPCTVSRTPSRARDLLSNRN